MADPTGDPATRDRPGTPTWVKVLGIAALVLALLVAVLMLVSGGQHGPGMHAPSGGAGGQTPPSSGPANAGRVGEPASATDAARTVAVTTLDTMVFEPGTIEVAAGEVVTFVVTSNGQAAHEFTLGDAAMHQERAAAMAHDLPNSITLQPGETKELTWRFGDAATLEYGCHEAGHYEAGMRGRITVG
ncbi:MAG: cupredoxin domain-containing protein [Chloroflexi bacterium]|nr:cupredoxin domain-containing protein [Chloroflexota bacterium]